MTILEKFINFYGKSGWVLIKCWKLNEGNWWLTNCKVNVVRDLMQLDLLHVLGCVFIDVNEKCPECNAIGPFQYMTPVSESRIVWAIVRIIERIVISFFIRTIIRTVNKSSSFLIPGTSGTARLLFCWGIPRVTRLAKFKRYATFWRQRKIIKVFLCE